MNVLFIGLGSVGQRHLRNLVKLVPDDLHIYAYRVRGSNFVLTDTLGIEEGQSLESKYNIEVFHNLDDAWAVSYDAVFICNPSSMHTEALRAAVDHGCHVFIEKPVADSLAGLDEIAEKVRAQNLVVSVGYQNRYHPCIVKTRQALSDQVIGRVVSAHAEIGEDVTSWHKYEDYRTMYACRKDLGGGVVLSQIHELDYLYHFFGLPQSVYAVGGKLSDLEIDVEDTVDALFTFSQDGVSFPVVLHEDYLQLPPVRACKIIGTKGRIEFDLLASSLKIFDDEGTLVEDVIFDFVRNDMFVEELKAFMGAIRGEKTEYVSLQQGMDSLSLALAIKASLETNTLIALDKE